MRVLLASLHNSTKKISSHSITFINKMRWVGANLVKINFHEHLMAESLVAPNAKTANVDSRCFLFLSFSSLSPSPSTDDIKYTIISSPRTGGPKSTGAVAVMANLIINHARRGPFQALQALVLRQIHGGGLVQQRDGREQPLASS